MIELGEASDLTSERGEKYEERLDRECEEDPTRLVLFQVFNDETQTHIPGKFLAASTR